MTSPLIFQSLERSFAEASQQGVFCLQMQRFTGSPLRIDKTAGWQA